MHSRRRPRLPPCAVVVSTGSPADTPVGHVSARLSGPANHDTHERRLQLQVSRDPTDQILPHGARLDVGEDVPQLVDEPVLGFGRTDVGPLELTLHTEAGESPGFGYELADSRGALALQQVGRVRVGRKRRDEHLEAERPGERARAQNRRGTGIVAVEHQHRGRRELLSLAIWCSVIDVPINATVLTIPAWCIANASM